MKSKYERMNKCEKKEVYKQYKLENSELCKKMERALLLGKILFVVIILMFIYDFLVSKSSFNYYIDIFLFIFNILFLIRVCSTKKKLLSDYVIKGYKPNKKKA